MTDTDFGDSSPADLAFALQRTLRRRAAMGTRRVARPVPAPQAQQAAEPPPQPTRAPQQATRAAQQATEPQQQATELQQQATEPQQQATRPPQQAAQPPQQPKVSQTETYVPPKAPKQPTSAPDAAPAGQPAELAAACSSLEQLRAGVAHCHACGLAKSRTQTVFSDGQGTSRILFVGEAPGADEDRTGTPFVGRAGQLLTDIITKGMGLERDAVTIVNVLKCRPPGNRDPLPEEKDLCTGWLDRQIELVDPLVIVPLGRHAACHILGVDAPLGRLRGKVHDHGGRKVVPTYHPAYLLRSPHDKRKTWDDIQLAMHEAGIPLPGSR